MARLLCAILVLLMTQITFPEKVVWYKKITATTLLDNFSKRHQKRLRVALEKSESCAISGDIEVIDEHFLSWFIAYYTDKMSQKANPHLVDIRKILAKYSGKRACYGLTLSENGTPIGGAILIHKGNRITTAVKIFNPTWTDAEIPVSPALYAEYQLYAHAITHNYYTIYHGQDTNPYGINSDISLCAFKLSLGYRAKLPDKPETRTLELATVTTDFLALAFPDSGTDITKGDLYTTTENAPQYEMVTKYPESITVTVHIRQCQE